MSSLISQAADSALGRLISTFESHMAEGSADISAALQDDFTNIRLGWKESFSEKDKVSIIEAVILGLKDREDQLSDEAAATLPRVSEAFQIVGKSGDLMAFRMGLEEKIKS